MFLILIVILIVTIIYLKVIKPQNYWPEKGVKQRKQTFLLGDNAGVFFRKESFWDLSMNLYNAFPDERYMGSCQVTQPILVIRDPDLIKQMCVKDFDHFVDHMQFIPDGLDDLFNKNLLSLKGKRWREMRSTLSPSFTTSRMKIIFNLVSECAKDFTNYFLESSEDVQSVELKDIFTRYTNDVIATVSFGIKCDSLRDRDNEFYLRGKEATTFTGFWQNIKLFLLFATPQISKLLGFRFFTVAVREFFLRIIKEAINAREQQGIVRADMLQLLIEARKGRLKQEDHEDLIDTGFATVQETSNTSVNKINKQELTDIDITAQALIFFFAGFDTVATLMGFLGHELVENPEIQRKFQKEIDETSEECNGVLTYDALLKMKYMDMVVSEALRKWPVAIINDRVCTKQYTIQPVKSSERPVHIQPGDYIWFPSNGIHRDPKFYPDPDRFDPERFNEENKKNINPYTYFPFGVGPRNCIGSRFALIEIKTVFFHLLSKFDFVAVEKTQIPLKISKKSSISLIAENGIWVGLKTRIKVD